YVIRIYIVMFIWFCFIRYYNFFFFFFSSRRRHTRSYGDWSSDVCSSDLRLEPLLALVQGAHRIRARPRAAPAQGLGLRHGRAPRSEERRVGKECRSRWSTYH